MSAMYGSHSRRACWAVSAAVVLLVVLAIPLAARASQPTQQPKALHLHFASEMDAVSNELHLSGADATQQLLVTAELDGGGVRDFTRQVRYDVSPPGVARISSGGLVSACGDGTAAITASAAGVASASLRVTVESFTLDRPINFANQIVPIFTKLGCNGGGCHGKSGGQNGFRLSLLGFEPPEDYEHLVKESRGRRLFPAAPDRSLLLLKATGNLPHGGGKRMDVNSADYALLLRWVQQGMPYGKSTDPTVSGIELFPKIRIMPFDGEQQLVVLAHYTDGSTEDVTRSALFEANDKEVAQAAQDGRVTTFRQPGDCAVMVRYQARVAVFRATVPLGAVVQNLPPSRNFIDELVFNKLKEVGMPPSQPCDDATFLRRVTIDIAGRLPTVDEVKTFLANTEATKRDAWIDALLNSPGYADYFANKWSALLRNKRSAPRQARGNYEFFDWIRDSLRANKPYDQFVREVIASSGDVAENPPVAWYRHVKDPAAQVEDVAQLFLGMRLQCAHCHHHPFEKWSQQDYYGLAAFFSQVTRKPGMAPGEEIVFPRRLAPTAMNPKTRLTVNATGLGAVPLDVSPDEDARQSLVDWMVREDNPFFAKALVNRYWKHFFGRGLVEPEDDMRETNPPTNPEVLNALARHFVDSGYDLKDLVRTIVHSQVYQLSAIPNDYNAVDKQNFSRYYPKRLTAEVLLDAINQVTKTESHFEALPAGTKAIELPDNSYNETNYFLTVFGRPESSSACECERSQDASLAQSLHLFNSEDVQQRLTSDKGLPAELAADKARDFDTKIGDLYFAAYGRAPDATELRLARDYLDGKRNNHAANEDLAKTDRHAYEDIVWAILNSKEFLFNH